MGNRASWDRGRCSAVIGRRRFVRRGDSGAVGLAGAALIGFTGDGDPRPATMPFVTTMGLAPTAAATRIGAGQIPAVATRNPGGIAAEALGARATRRVQTSSVRLRATESPARALLLVLLAAIVLFAACSDDAATEEPDSAGEESELAANLGAWPEPPEEPVNAVLLRDVEHWFYYIDVNLEEDTVDEIAASEYELVVLDFIPSEEQNTDYAMRDVTDWLHDSHDGRLVLAYIDIGQAENFRTYWRPEWRIGDPAWIAGGDPDGWEGNFPVAFWRDEWRELWLGEGGYLEGVLGHGFDGVYLDWVEAYSDENVLAIADEDGVDPREEMIAWVADIAAFGRERRPGFIVITQNAAELAEAPEYLAIIDAIAQEQVWFDGSADNEPPGDCPLPRTMADVDSDAYYDALSEQCQRQFDEFPESTLHISSDEYLHYLTLARDEGVPIFTVDYAVEHDNVASVFSESRSHGFVPFASNRALDQFVPPRP